ncbi:peroxidase-like [Myzus persicae]|uniref:peroxidase-like n=1 Tax=Myzus persicae TaxID=13164 RepID=UPI000B9390F6|nr:peroxidase-like [Myzus persicae]XP_022164641.1 peroxidase-like [Myzus persicae]
MSSSISIQLLICIVVFLPSCYRGETELNKEDSSNQFLNLKTQDLENAIQYGTQQINMLSRHEDSLSYADVHVKIGSPSHGQLIDSQPSIDGHLASRNAEIVIKASHYIMNKHCSGSGISKIQCAKDLAKVKLDQTSLGRMCLSKYFNETACAGRNLKYRSADGSCNNLKHSFWGNANTAYKRLLFPVYKDGLSSIKELPNSRELSTGLVNDENSPDSVKTIAMAYWTIFIGHDLSHTAVSSMLKTNKSVDCCNENGMKQSPRYTHPSCAPIIIPKDDRFFSPLRRTCMNYVRSVPAMRTDCTFGPREQLNQATHFLDGSMIYGSSAQQTWSLRSKSRGQLLTHTGGDGDSDSDSDGDPLRPQYMPLAASESNACQSDGDGAGTCYTAGDVRANAQPHLTAMHTLWMREHNRVAGLLAVVNPHWDDERAFQEARKIVVASIQHVTYGEWLPALLGKKYTKRNGLELLPKGYSDAYDENADPTVSNSFATAILPFVNSMFNETLSLYFENRVTNKSLSLKEHFNRPSDLQMNYMDHLIRGLSMQNTQKVDMLFTQTITNYLYSHPDNMFGMDIVSLDIQRSRDHGIPSYTQFRKYCGLKEIKNVQDLTQIMVKGSTNKLLRQYKTWDDIDLLIGALFEKHEDDAMVGPTMRCIIREQFIRTRTADRYFYDLPKVFKKHQLAEIRKVTLARVFCDNSDNVTKMQQRVFFKPVSAEDDLLSCDSLLIPKINLKHWLETVDANRK